MSSLSSTANDRLYGYSSAFMTLNSLTAAFEFYNTIVSTVIVPQGAALIAHHVVTLALCFVGVAPYAHYYGLFFFGIANVSSIPLAAFTICDALRCRFPTFEAPYNHLRTAFGISFLLVRVVIWPCLSVLFWADVYAALRGGRVHHFAATAFLLIANIFLTGLQFMWGRKVWRGLLKVVFGGHRGFAAGKSRRADKSNAASPSSPPEFPVVPLMDAPSSPSSDAESRPLARSARHTANEAV